MVRLHSDPTSGDESVAPFVCVWRPVSAGSAGDTRAVSGVDAASKKHGSDPSSSSPVGRYAPSTFCQEK